MAIPFSFQKGEGMKGYFKYFSKKLGWYLGTLLVALFLNFLLPRLVPGNPVDQIVHRITVGMHDTDKIKSTYENFYKEYHLDKSIGEQFVIYIKDIAKGDFGTSFSMYPRKVNDIIARAIPWTLAIQVPAIIVGWLLGNILGAFAAYKKGFYDKVIFPASLFISSVPFFVLSILLLYGFSVKLGWFPVGGAYDRTMIPSASLIFYQSVLKHHFLPFLSIALIMLGGQGIGMREMALYELSSDYVRYSKMLGIRESKIIRYVFKNAILPQITGLAVSLGTMIAGALITEIVFNYPGIGLTMFKALRALDYPMISACTLLITFTVLIANFLVDIAYGFLDPRVKANQMEEC